MYSKFGTHDYFIVGKLKVADKVNMNALSEAQDIKVTPTHDICCNIVAHMEDSKDFMTIESLGIRPPPICRTCKTCEICRPASQFLSLKEHQELNIIKSKLSYDEKEKTWTAEYPFYKSPKVLNDNFETALKLLIKRENNMMKDESLMLKYNEQVQDFVNRGVIRKLTRDELEKWTGPVRYVDHREIFKEGSTTPVRIVINSSLKSKNEFRVNIAQKFITSNS